MMMWVGESVGEFVGEDLEEGGDGGDFGRVVVGFGGLKLLVGGFVEGDGVGERRCRVLVMRMVFLLVRGVASSSSFLSSPASG